MKAIIFIALIAFASAQFLSVPFTLKPDSEIFYEEWAQPHVDYVNAKGAKWTAGHNPYFLGRSLKTVKNNLGGIRVKSKYPPTEIEIPETFAQSFNSQTQWPKCDSIKDIRNQANCGCCWAFGSSEAFSDRICIASGQTKQTRISTDDTCFCSGGNGCGGGSNDAAWGYFSQTGAVTGLDYTSPPADYCSNFGIQPCCLPQEPCTAHIPTCPNIEGHPSLPCPSTCNTQYGKSWSSDIHMCGSPNSIQGVSQMMSEIQTNGPIECDYTVYGDFPTYRSGVYTHQSGQALGGHCIKVTGWGVESGTNYWLVANSWSIWWGDNGYFKIEKGTDCCGIEDSCMAGIPSGYGKE